MSTWDSHELSAGTLPSHLTSWLHRLSAEDQPQSGQQSLRSVSPEAADCLRRAAECYARAGGQAGAGRDRANWLAKACNLFEQLGDQARAASGREQLGQWLAAAQSWEQIGNWEAAARCFMKGDRPEDAAECYRRADRLLEAAWTLSRHAGRHQRARTLIDGLTFQEPLERLELEIVHASCDVGEVLHRAAAHRLRRSAVELFGLSDSRRLRLLDRVFEVVEALRRPELTGILHASATSRQLTGASSRWKHWARQWSDDHEMFSYQQDEFTTPFGESSSTPPDDADAYTSRG